MFINSRPINSTMKETTFNLRRGQKNGKSISIDFMDRLTNRKREKQRICSEAEDRNNEHKYKNNNNNNTPLNNLKDLLTQERPTHLRPKTDQRAHDNRGTGRLDWGKTQTSPEHRALSSRPPKLNSKCRSSK